MAALGQQVRDAPDDMLRAYLRDDNVQKRLTRESQITFWALCDTPNLSPIHLATLFNRASLLGGGIDPDNTPDADCEGFLNKVAQERTDEVMYFLLVKPDCKLTDALPAFAFMAYMIGKLTIQGEL